MERKITTNVGDTKEMWKHLKNCISMSKETNTINKVLIHENVYTTENDIAQALNDYFVDSITEICLNIEIIDKEFPILPNFAYSFKFQEIETDEVIKIAGSFKNRIGGRKLLSEGVIRDAVSYLGFFYMQIVNESLKNGVFPTSWKTSTVVPIEKVKNTIKADEMRPINTLPNDEKYLNA